MNPYAYVEGNPVSKVDPTGKFGVVGFGVGVFAGGAAGYISGGWQGAVIGGVTGAVIGIVAPWASYEVGTLAGAEIGGMLGSTTAFVGTNAVAGLGGAIAANAWTGEPLLHDAGWGAAIGALAPLGSGEAAFVGAGSADALGMTASADAAFSAGTGFWSVIGALADPNSDHGLHKMLNQSMKCP